MAKFDKSRDFGEISGGDTQARYFQDGLFFDVHGNELPGQAKPKAAAARAKKEEAPAEAPAAAGQAKPKAAAARAKKEEAPAEAPAAAGQVEAQLDEQFKD